MKPFYKIATDIKFNFDPEEITKNFFTYYNKNNIPYMDPSGQPHWQQQDYTNLLLGRNIEKNYKHIADELIMNLNNIKENLINSNDLTNEFLNHTLDRRRFTIGSIVSKKDVNPHIDKRVKTVIIFGLKNSNICETIFTNDGSFILNDGDAYIMSVQNEHSVKRLKDTNDKRFILRYIVSFADNYDFKA